MNEILLTATETNIHTLINYGMAVIIGFLVFRAMKDFINAINEPETGLKEAFQKCRKRVYAVLIAITAESTIVFIQHFYR